MPNKYEKFLLSTGSILLTKMGFKQSLSNIVNDDERFITENYKRDFFNYIKDLKDEKTILDQCDSFFYSPPEAPVNRKKYLLKGEIQSSYIYKTELGRVMRKKAFQRSLNKIVFKYSLKGGLTAPSDNFYDDIIRQLIVEFDTRTNDNTTIFSEFCTKIGISEEKLSEFPIWTFENFGGDDNVFNGYEFKKLPCILGLPGPDYRTGKDYQKVDRIAFSIMIPKESGIKVHKPTSFDAGMNSVWEIGGRTKPHTDCVHKYTIGFSEYIHYPVTLKSITSEIFQL